MSKIKIGTFLNDLAKKAGIDTTTPEFVDLLSTNFEIPSVIAEGINAKLMNLDAAENNPALRDTFKRKYVAEALDGVDAQIKNILSAVKFEDADLAEINAATGTYKKLEILGSKVKNIAEGKGAKKPEVDALTKQIDELNSQLGKLKGDFETEKTGLLSTHENELTSLALQSMLSAKQYALPEDMPAERKAKIALDSLKEDLEAKGLQIKRVNGHPVLLKKDGSKYYNEANNLEVSLNDYTDGVLNANKLLKVSGEGSEKKSIILPENGGAGKAIDLNAANAMEAAALSMMSK